MAPRTWPSSWAARKPKSAGGLFRPDFVYGRWLFWRADRFGSDFPAKFNALMNRLRQDRDRRDREPEDPAA